MPGKPFTSETAAEAGRKSKKRGIEQQVQEFLAENWKDGEEKTRLQLIYDALLKFGLKGNVKAIDTLLDRGFGKSKQAIEVTGEDGGPIDSKITIEFVKPKD